MTTQLQIFQSRLYLKFLDFHIRNPRIYVVFEKLTLDAIRRGKRFGAKAVAERLRWETDVGAKDEDFKINNNYVSFYARLFAERNPAYKDYFRYREHS